MGSDESFDFFIFINSSVRGPYLLVHLRSSPFHWSDMFLSRLDSQTKWVGSTISCALTPHVRTPVVNTDRVGLNVITRSQ